MTNTLADPNGIEQGTQLRKMAEFLAVHRKKNFFYRKNLQRPLTPYVGSQGLKVSFFKNSFRVLLIHYGVKCSSGTLLQQTACIRGP
jgi:hypothetical protein